MLRGNSHGALTIATNQLRSGIGMTDSRDIPELLSPPAPLVRPKFAQFLFDRGLNYREAGERLGRTREWARLVCLPFDDPRRRIPDAEDIRLIVTWTGGVVTPADFYPPELSQSPTADGEVTP